MATKTEILEGVAKLIDTESGVAELVTFLFQDEQTENLNRNQYQNFLGRVQSSWAKLEGAKKEAVAESIRRLMEMNGVTAADLGFGDAAKSKTKTPKKEGIPSPQRAVWFMTPSGEVDFALDNTKGGYDSEDVKLFVDHAKSILGKTKVSRSSFLVAGDPSNVGIDDVLTKEEFIKKVDQLGIRPA